MNSWHSLKAEDVLKKLQSSSKGLSEQEAENRLQKYGYNRIERIRKHTPLEILISQFKSPLIYLLLLATAASFIIGHTFDALMILAIVILNAILGFYQDYKSEKAIEALRSLIKKKARVLRGGREEEIDSAFLVPGDIILIDAGDEIPADARVIESADLQVNEAALTGESFPIMKTVKAVNEKTTLPERTDMLHAGTLAMNGFCKAIIVATGMKTELGKIAALTQEADRKKTHIEIVLEKLASKLLLFFVAVSAAVAVLGLVMGNEIMDMIILGISLAVASVPEGLPAVVTIVFALGLRRLSKVNTLVRKLGAVETLGAVTYVCADKTGTLTKNEMTVTKIDVDGETVEVSGVGYSSEGKFSKKTPSLKRLLEIGALCNHAVIEESTVIGDPTEAALIVAAAKLGMEKHQLEKEYVPLGEISFSLERKMMSVITKNGGKIMMSTKGAPENVLAKCTQILSKGKVKRLTAAEKKKILAKTEELASSGYRVLSLAYREMKKFEKKEENLVYVGSVALIDPVREEAKWAIDEAKKAGIKVMIVTGDHTNTAVAIAKNVGLFEKGSIALTGDEFDSISDDELLKKIDRIRVFGRVTPEQKMRVLKLLQNQGEVVAMTGDGVNDAPALKRADIGIAMGKVGTDVARESSEIVLADDNFSSIVKGIREGRGIFMNIRRFVYYLLSSNMAEVLILFLAMLFGWPLILLPVQILWINLVTDSVTALSLGAEPTSKNVMKRPPRDPHEGIVSNRSLAGLLGLAVVKTIGVLFVFSIILPEGEMVARTMAFVTLIFAENYNIFNFKSFDRPLHRINILNNPYILLAVAITLLLTVGVVQIPAISPLFHAVSLDLSHWILALAFGVPVLIAGEIYKNVVYLRRK